MKQLHGKSALVTGGSQGLGLYIAEALIREGINVALVARSAGKLEQAVRELSWHGGRVMAISADITVAADRSRLIQQAESRMGQIDILVNNVGISHWKLFADQDEKEITDTINTNLLAPILLSRAMLPGMLRRGYGHIVNISSLGGKKGVSYEASYCASKAGLIEWTSGLTMELEGTGVGVSVLCPIYISNTGEFASYGVPPPRLAGSVKAEQVARAVIKAIKEDLQEVIVRTMPSRPLLALNALSPSFGSIIIRFMG